MKRTFYFILLALGASLQLWCQISQDSLCREVRGKADLIYSDRPKAIEIYQSYLRTVDSLRYPQAYLWVLHYNSIITLNENNHDEGLAFLRRAATMQLQCHLEERLSVTYFNMAIAFRRKDDIASSIEYSNKAFDAAIAYNFPEVKVKSLLNLGYIYGRLGMHEEADEYLQQSVEIAEYHNDTTLIAEAKLFSINPAIKIKNIEQARQYLESVEPIVKQSMLKPFLCVYYNRAAYFHLSENAPKALELARQSTKLAKEINMDDLVLWGLYMQGIVYFQKNALDQAMDYLLQALKVNEEVRQRELDIIIYKALIPLLEQQGDIQKALYYSKALNAVEAAHEKTNITTQLTLVSKKIEAYNKNKTLLVQQVLLSKEQNRALYHKILNSVWGAFIALGIIGFGLWAIRRTHRAKLAFKKSVEEQNRILTQKIRQKKSFIDSISHELRTPIYSMMGILEILKKPINKVEWDHYLTTLFHVTHSYSYFIDNILILKDLPFLKLENRNIDITSVITGITEVIMALGTTNFFEIKVASDIPKIEGDVTKLNKILFNLIHNANKFTYNGKITIEVSKIQSRYSGIDLLFSVKDSGIGIQENKKNEIFERFNYIASREEGLGIGLNVVNVLLQVLGSKLEVDSTLGVGSNFYFFVTFDTFKRPASPVPAPTLPNFYLVDR